jgi:hypothetical protein
VKSRRLAVSGQKTTPKYGVVTKAEIDTLFERLRYLYEDLYTPIPRIALPFPLQLVARVRVWRGQTVPDAGRFLKAVESVARNGMSPVEVETLVMVNETLFRPMRAVELELEAQDWTAKFFGWAERRSRQLPACSFASSGKKQRRRSARSGTWPRGDGHCRSAENRR